MNEADPTIVLGIPGCWKDRDDMVNTIARSSGGYVLEGKSLVNEVTGGKIEVYIDDHDSSIVEEVSYGVLGHMSDEESQAMQNYTFMIYLMTYEAGHEVVEDMMDAAVGILDAGGLVVKSQNSGFYVGAAKWREYAKEKTAHGMFRALVGMLGDNEEFYTYGMHAFALPDCAVIGEDGATAVEIAKEFCGYMLDEAPQLDDGDKFSITVDAPVYQISLEEYSYDAPDDGFVNPRGLWRLEKV